MANRSKRRHSSRGKRSRKVGLPPGTLVTTDEGMAETVRITYMDYSEQTFSEKQVESIEECFQFKDTATVTWINIDGIGNIPVIEKLGKAFDLHPLILEDIVTAGQRPKFDDYEKYGYIVLNMLRYNPANHGVESEQVSIIFGPNFVISFQEKVGDIFDPIRDRIRFAKGRVRRMGADYLAYSLVDAIVDGYFGILEEIGERIEDLEDELLARPTEGSVRQIHVLKREMMSLRRSVWPMRELVNGMLRNESSLVSQQTRVYLRDVYDHSIQIIDAIESYRDMVAGMLDLYLSGIGNRTNAVMKVLTIIATIFIPLTFITGFFGMNWRHMPELEWRWGQPGVVLVMLVIALMMLIYFRRKKWL